MRSKKENVTSQQIAPEDEGNAPKTPPAQATDQFIYLQDFPQTLEDFEALVSIGFTKLNGVNLIEELFNREIEDENDDITPEEDEAKRQEEIKQAAAQA